MRPLPEPDMRVVYAFFAVLAAVMTFFTAAHAGRAPLPLALLAAAGVLAALLALMVPLTKKRRAL